MNLKTRKITGVQKQTIVKKKKSYKYLWVAICWYIYWNQLYNLIVQIFK